MSLEILGQIYGVQKSIDKLNENILMIAWQLYISNNMDADKNSYATIKNFLRDKEELQKGG